MIEKIEDTRPLRLVVNMGGVHSWISIEPYRRLGRGFVWILHTRACVARVGARVDDRLDDGVPVKAEVETCVGANACTHKDESRHRDCEQDSTHPPFSLIRQDQLDTKIWTVNCAASGSSSPSLQVDGFWPGITGQTRLPTTSVRTHLALPGLAAPPTLPARAPGSTALRTPSQTPQRSCPGPAQARGR